MTAATDTATDSDTPDAAADTVEFAGLTFTAETPIGAALAAEYTANEEARE
jgi:hypothetical protein